jgi:chemotaxis protein MotB
MDILDIQSARISLQSGLGIFEGGKKTSVGLVSPLSSYNIGTATFTKQIEESIESLDSATGIRVLFEEKGIIIDLDEAILFSAGEYKLSPKGEASLDKISSKILNKISNDIRIEGHTDADPIKSDKFPSNWELSIARSVSVVKYLSGPGKIKPERLSAVGYGESKPLFPNTTAENKNRNRRVEIVITTNDNIRE